MKFQITKEQLEKIVNYLASRPFIEVHALIQMIQTFEPTKEQSPASPEPTPLKAV